MRIPRDERAGGIRGDSRAPRIRTLGRAALVFAGLALDRGRSWAQDSILAEVLPEGNFIAVGVGPYPDYIGSDDYTIGAAPLIRYQYWGKRELSLIGNTLSVNLLDAGGWRLGPSGILRFGRSGVEDKVVDRVHEVDPSLDLGGFVGYTWVGDDPRNGQPRRVDGGSERVRRVPGLAAADAGGRWGDHVRQPVLHDGLLRRDGGGLPGQRPPRVPAGCGDPRRAGLAGRARAPEPQLDGGGWPDLLLARGRGGAQPDRCGPRLPNQWIGGIGGMYLW
jgi:MltA-interacting protein MipA